MTEGVTYVTNSISSLQSCQSQIQFIIQKPLLQLSSVAVALSASQELPANYLCDVQHSADVISTCLKFLSGNQIQSDAFFPIFKELWVILQSLFYFLQTNEDVIEKLSRLIKHSIKLLKQNQVEEYLTELTSLITNYFKV